MRLGRKGRQLGQLQISNMTRDMDLIRHLLILLEAKPGPELLKVSDIEAEGYSPSVIQYHLNLMYQAGLINGEDVRSSTSSRLIKVMPFDLTWQGHEFLEHIRDPEIWRQAKAGASRAGTASIEFIWGMAKVLLKNTIRQHTGLDIG